MLEYIYATYFSYNDDGANEYAWPTKITNASGQTTTASYDYNIGKPSTTTNSNGGVTSYTYTDPLDRVKTVVRPNGGTIIYSYSSYPDLNTVTIKQDQTIANDGLLQVKSIYDGLGRLQESDTYDGGAYIGTTQTYNAQGLVAAATNPSRTGDSLNFMTSYAYDSLGRQTQVKTPDNAVATTIYSGSYTVSEDQAHHKRAMLADGLGRTKTAVEDPDTLNLSTSYSYDTQDNLTLVTQGVTCPATPTVPPAAPTAGCRYYTYDSLSRLTKSVQPESGKVSYSYDAASNMYQRTDARGLVTTYSYDALNRILQQSYTGGTPAVSYTYDSAPNGKGMLATAANGSSATNYLAYDAMGEVVLSNQVTGGQTYPFSYGYNLAGALTSETYPSGRVLTMLYDPAGRTSQVAGAKGGNTTTYVSNLMYAPQGTPTQYKYGNDVWRQATYNNRLQPDTTTDQVSNNPSNCC